MSFFSYCCGSPETFPPSDSGSFIPPNSSSVAASGLSFSAINNDGCTCPVLPRRWSVTLPPAFAVGYHICPNMCSNYYFGQTHILSFVAKSNCGVRYETDERAIATNTVACQVDNNIPRALLTIEGSGGSLLAVLRFYYSGGGFIGSFGFPYYSSYANIISDSNQFRRPGTNDISSPFDCLGSSVLYRSYQYSSVWFCGFGNQTQLPGITITPA